MHMVIFVFLDPCPPSDDDVSPIPKGEAFLSCIRCARSVTNLMSYVKMHQLGVSHRPSTDEGESPAQSPPTEAERGAEVSHKTPDDVLADFERRCQLLLRVSSFETAMTSSGAHADWTPSTPGMVPHLQQQQQQHQQLQIQQLFRRRRGTMLGAMPPVTPGSTPSRLLGGEEPGTGSVHCLHFQYFLCYCNFFFCFFVFWFMDVLIRC